MNILLVAISCVVFCHSVLGANIIFLFAGGNVSHKMSIWPFVAGLAEAGHKVTFVSSSDKKLRSSSNITDVTPTTFKLMTQEMYRLNRFKLRLEGDTWDLSDPGYDEASVGFCEATMRVYQEDAAFRTMIDEGQFDLAIVNGVFSECGLFLAHHMKAKVIVYSSSTMLPWFFGSMGAPVEASSVPELAFQGGYPMSFMERAWNVHRYWVGYNRRDSLSQNLQALYRKTFKVNDPVPSLTDLERNAALVFINTHYSIDFPRSLPPSFVSVGGMQCFEEIGKLPKEFDDFMNAAEEGVVLITFGSTIDLSTLDSYYINIFFEAMRKLSKFRFIWRWDGPMPEGHPENLLGGKWLPQREILNHPKTRAFMTHGGLNGINEATYHGVPLIVLPLFADQDFNAIRIQAQELGVAVELKEFSQKLLDNAFREVLENKKYKRNMEVRSGMFKDRRMNPVEEAIFWTEFVLRHDDTSALRPMLPEQPWHVRNSLDVYFLLFTFVTTLPLVLTNHNMQMTNINGLSTNGGSMSTNGGFMSTSFPMEYSENDSHLAKQKDCQDHGQSTHGKRNYYSLIGILYGNRFQPNVPRFSHRSVSSDYNAKENRQSHV